MKIFGTDLGIKHICFKDEENNVYRIYFRYSLFKGITEVSYCKEIPNKKNFSGYDIKPIKIEVVDTFPNLKGAIKEAYSMRGLGKKRKKCKSSK
ncbi:MAG: hypothetical protein HFF36_10570 [Coprobacillus sp.]|nr:hypothetical protein [Coprobacillus sp.]